MRLIAALALLLLSAAPVLARDGGQPGRFDYYILSLSWSPTWCGSKAGREDAEQCDGARRYGFVVHGLWPQYHKGGFPEACRTAEPVPAPVVEDMLPVMPSRRLVQHEWARHGTCSGAQPAEYFSRARQAFERVRLPKPFQAPERPLTLPVDQVEKLFIAANPGLTAESVAVVCRGHHAAEVRVCFDKDLNFRPCSRDVRDRCKGEALFPAAR